MFLCITAVWLAIIVWGGTTANWATAIPVGQFILSSIAFVFHYTKDWICLTYINLSTVSITLSVIVYSKPAKERTRRK
jgi:hypothetical protein